MQNILNALLGCSLFATNRNIVQETPIQNANHIFNAIHSSMRQWGSSLNHNGMSFFMATVPEGTQFYHGTSIPDRINGTEWLAFEPEHALVFARSHHGPPPRKGGPHKHPPFLDHLGHRGHSEDERWDHVGAIKGTEHRPKYMVLHHDKPHHDKPHHVKSHHDKPHYDEARTKQSHHSAGDRSPLHTGLKRDYGQGPSKRLRIHDDILIDDETSGFLHTYRARHDLRLLYIDGQSAAKSRKGTLDTQDTVLLHDHPPDADDRPGGPMGESYRAEHLCGLARTEWQGKVNGFLRMEMGFEVILCSFAQDLHIERISRAKSREPNGPQRHHDEGDDLRYYQAVASRFDGIGGDRVSLNYDSFISTFAMEDVVYFDDANLPRIRNESKVVRPVLAAVKEMVLSKTEGGTNWQTITDMVVSRYADAIEYLSSGDLPDLLSMKQEVDRILRPLIDYDERNRTAEIERCAVQYVPQQPVSFHLASAAILNVTTTLCTTLSDMEVVESYTESINMARDLKSWLAWTTWKRCRGCGYHEVCFVPIWPMGGSEEFERPRCLSNMSEVSRGYWFTDESA